MERSGTELNADASPEHGGGVVGVASVEPAGRVVETGGHGLLAGFVLAAGVVVLTMTVLLRGKRLRAERSLRSASASGAGASSLPALSPGDAQAVAEASRARLLHAEKEARSRQTLEALMVEVQELTRLCAGQIENRAVRLERLIAEADVRLAALRAIESGQAAAERVATVSTRSVRAGRAGERGEAGERKLVEPLPPEALRRSSVLTMHGVEGEPGCGSGAGSGGMEPLTRRVYELADRGMSALDIARRLEEQIGKVQLILSLRRG